MSMLETCVGFKHSGVLSSVIIPEKGPICIKLEEHGIHYKIIEHRISKETSRLQIFIIAVQFFVFIKKNRFNILHSNDIHCFRILSFVGKLLRIKTFCHVRYKLSRETIRYFLKRKPDALIFNSFFMKNEFEKNENNSEFSKKYVVYNPFNERNYFKPAYRKHMREKWNAVNKFVIGIVGNIGKEKGVFDFVKIAHSLQNYYSDTVFIVVGEDLTDDQSELGRLYEATRACDMFEQFVFHGHESEVGKVFSGMDLFLFPSHFESFGRVVIEALLSRLPVVASRVGGLKEILEGNPGARLVDPGDIDGFVREIIMIRTLIDSDKKDFIEAGKKKAIKAFSVESITDQLLKIYNRDLGE